jgi:hypothetical protein
MSNEELSEGCPVPTFFPHTPLHIRPNNPLDDDITWSGSTKQNNAEPDNSRPECRSQQTHYQLPGIHPKRPFFNFQTDQQFNFHLPLARLAESVQIKFVTS